RWPSLVTTLRRAALLDHDTALGIRELGLDHDPPYVVREWLEGKSLAETFADHVNATTAMRIGMTLADVLAAAHRLGLVHGRLSPGPIWLSPAGLAKIDFTGIAAGRAPDHHPLPPVAASCRAPELSGIPTAEADLFSLGAILLWLLNGRPWERSTAP